MNAASATCAKHVNAIKDMWLLSQAQIGSVAVHLASVSIVHTPLPLEQRT